MYLFASILLTFAFLCTAASACLLIIRLAGGDAAPVRIPEKSLPLLHIPVAVCMTAASAILLYAFIACDFRVEYVFNYSDLTLPLFYRITAFWAGQSGSMLFWAWAVALSGLAFAVFPPYRRLGMRTKLWYWLFFFSVMGFFLLIITVWSNPFVTISNPPQDGRGLNPLLQNPGMIFHPPLLFLGYGGFVVPGCLALAQAMSGRLYAPRQGERLEENWGQVSRPFILIAWSLLTAGIVLGAWWAYMELGWGGYWAWDPVENASLIPWLVATACLHTTVIESRRGKLHRTNVFLMALTTISAFFATYLVRSGVVQSLHAFGDGGVGAPLLTFTLASLYLVAFIALCVPAENGNARFRPVLGFFCYTLVALLLAVAALNFLKPELLPLCFFLLTLNLLVLLGLAAAPNPEARPLENLGSKEGLLLVVAWLLLALSFVILTATMWPVFINALSDISGYLPESISSGFPDKPMGLEAGFYNQVCLPLFAMFAVLLVVCPYRKWKTHARTSGFHQVPMLGVALGCALASGICLWLVGIRNPIALLAASCSLAALVGIVMLFAGNASLLKVRSTLAAHGVHIGLLMMILGVAFSGPYQKKHTLEIARGQTVSLGEHRIVLNELYEGESQVRPDGKPNYRFIEAELLVTDKEGNTLGVLSPQRRIYSNFEKQTYAEVSTLFSLGNEFYATLLSLDENDKATVAVNVNPLVNWLWIGGTLMCLFPFIGLARVGRQKEREEERLEEKDEDDAREVGENFAPAGGSG